MPATASAMAPTPVRWLDTKGWAASQWDAAKIEFNKFSNIYSDMTCHCTLYMLIPFGFGKGMDRHSACMDSSKTGKVAATAVAHG